MENEESGINYWALSFHALAHHCFNVANEAALHVDPALRAEARQLHSSWIESLELPQEEFEDASRRASILSALRRRSIEVLVRVER